jgi:hypothetical protein
MVIFALFSFSSKDLKTSTSNLDVSYFAKKKKIIKTRKLALTKAGYAEADVNTFEAKADSIYNNIDSTNFLMPDHKVFQKALKGFYAFKANGQVEKDIITIIDFSLSSTAKRLWVIDLNSNKVLYQSLVAHGIKSGDEFANSFSNKGNSYKSSLGFYVTGETYKGKHGMSLKLDGLEKGINDNARPRGVVFHGSDYVSDSFVKSHQKLGRSQGCPALPKELSGKIIGTIKNKSCLFIYHPSLSETSLTEIT